MFDFDISRSGLGIDDGLVLPEALAPLWHISDTLAFAPGALISISASHYRWEDRD